MLAAQLHEARCASRRAAPARRPCCMQANSAHLPSVVHAAVRIVQAWICAAFTSLSSLQGCVSQVWVVPDVRDGKIYWRADSDAQLTKGLAALLVKGLSGCAPEEIVNVEADFIEMLGLKQSLTPSRNNGFLNMFRLMQARAHYSLQHIMTGPHD